jgi:hypothetical protein
MTNVVALLVCAPAAGAQDAATFLDRAARMQKQEGYVPLYWDEEKGRLYLELSRFDEELLCVTSLPAGVGSNDIGLDRWQIGVSTSSAFTV